MAKNINETGNNVRQLSPRKPGAGRKVAASAAAAAKADEMMGAKPASPPLGELPESAPSVTAPSFGANEPDCSTFLKHVKVLREHEGRLDEAKLVVKTLNKEKKDLRVAAEQCGIVLGELDIALKHLDTERVDLDAKLARYKLYMEWLGRPVGVQGALPGMPEPTDLERRRMMWFQRGDQAGRLAQKREAPKGCVGDDLQSFLEGHDAGQKALMQSSPLTRDAFDKKGNLKTTAAPTATTAGPAVLVFNEAHFATGTGLEDANLKTLLEEHHPAFAAAERVVALFGAKRRVLKEPNGDGTWYVDTGEPDAEITEPEEVPEAAAAAAPTASDFG